MPKQSTSQKNEIKLSLMSQQTNYIQQDVQEIKTTLQDFIKKADETYSTKQELKALESKVNDLSSLRDWVTRIILGAVIFAVLALIGLEGR
jgi:uncharacterized protein YigA (DUF484 family)